MAHFNNHTSAEEVCNAFSAQIKGRAFLITGTSAKGMGAKYALVLAKHGPAQILLLSRSQEKVDPVITDIRATNPGVDVKFIQCELSDQDSVRRAARTLLDDATVPKIDVVINNAGMMATKDYTVDRQGIELQLSSNHIGHFLLTNLLMPKILAAGEGARIVNITSHGHRIGPFRFDDPSFGGGEQYDAWEAYGQSKTANVLFSIELARRLQDRGVQAFSVDPGLVMTTGLGEHIDFMAEFPALLAAAEKNNPGLLWTLEGQEKNDSQGCSSGLMAALNPEWKDRSGAYISHCQVGEALEYARDLDNAKKLWAYSEEVTGQKFDI